MPIQVVTILILDDLIVENNESFGVTVTTFDTLRSQTATVTIRDDDSKLHCSCICIAIMLFETCFSYKILFIHFIGVTIGFNVTEYSVSEGAGSVSAIVYVLSGTLDRNVRVTVFTSTDSAGGRNK